MLFDIRIKRMDISAAAYAASCAAAAVATAVATGGTFSSTSVDPLPVGHHVLVDGYISDLVASNQYYQQRKGAKFRADTQDYSPLAEINSFLPGNCLLLIVALTMRCQQL